MKKLFNVKSLLLALVLVCMFGVVSASAEEDPTPTPTPAPEYMTDAGVAVGGDYYLKKAGAGATYKSITKVDGKAGEVGTVADKLNYFIPTYKVKYDGIADTLTIVVYEGEAAIAPTGTKLYVVASDKALKKITAAQLKKYGKAIETAENGLKVDIAADLGVATGKDAYVYAVLFTGEPAMDITKPATYLAAKVAKGDVDVNSIGINYYLMDSDLATASGVITAKKKTATGEEAIAEDNLIYKTDAENSTWAAAKYTAAAGEAAAVPGFTPKALYEAVSYAAGKKAPKLFVRTKGTDATLATYVADTFPGKRPGKEKSVALKLQSKASSIKFDAKTGTIAVKNGFDYQVKDSGEYTEAVVAAYNIESWKVVLPYNKAGTGAKEVTQTAEAPYIPEDKFIAPDPEATPAVAGNAAKYTATKVTSIAVVNTTAKVYLVRKSATTKAPASQVTIISVPAQAAAPSMGTGNYAEVDYVAGKAVNLEAPTINNGSDDTATAKYEYAIINKGDYATDDSRVIWSSIKWTSLKEGTKIKTTARSKYYTKADVDNAATYGDKLSAKEHDAVYSKNVYILVRRCGEATATANVVPSNVLVTVVDVAETAGVPTKYTWKAAPTPTP